MTSRKTLFDKKFRGYDEAEVDNYMYKSKKSNEDLKHRISMLQSKYGSAKRQLSHYHKMEHTMQQAILDAQETADEIKVTARQEAKDLLNKARTDSESKMQDATKRADSIINSAMSRSSNISKGAMSLCKNIRRFRRQIIILLNSQLSFTKSSHWDHMFSLTKRPKHRSNSGMDNGLHSSDSMLKNLKDSNSLKAKVDHKNGFAEVMYPNGKIKELKKL